MTAPLILASNTISGEYEVANSLRFDDGSSDYLSRTPSSAGNRKTWTWSAWVKRSGLGFGQRIFHASTDANNRTEIYFTTADKLEFFSRVSSSTKGHITTNQVFRDTSAWYHFIFALDASNTSLKIYVNGSEITDLTTTTSIQNADQMVNSTNEHAIGRYTPATNNYFDGYMAEVVFIDGQQLDATSFGEFDEDTGIWKPIDVSGLTFGTNGFYLNFSDSSSLGADVSGNDNDFTVNNLTSIDQTTDTCTNNMPTINILQNYNSQTISEGNTKFITTSNTETHKQIGTTFGVDTGKWYWEVKGAVTGNDAGVGISSENVLNKPSNLTGVDGHLGDDPESWSYSATTGKIVNNNSGSAYGDSWNTEIIGVALDLDNAKLYFSKSGTWQNSGDPESGATGTGAVSITSGLLYFPATSAYDNNHGVLFNFGSPAFSITSGNSDANGYGNFEYSVPSGYYALNSKNLAEYG